MEGSSSVRNSASRQGGAAATENQARSRTSRRPSDTASGQSMRMNTRTAVVSRALGVLIVSATVLDAQTMPPESEQQLARAIYKEMIEIKSGFTTGATTPVAEAAARRLKAAGFADEDIFIGGAIP